MLKSILFILCLCVSIIVSVGPDSFTLSHIPFNHLRVMQSIPLTVRPRDSKISSSVFRYLYARKLKSGETFSDSTSVVVSCDLGREGGSINIWCTGQVIRKYKTFFYDDQIEIKGPVVSTSNPFTDRTYPFTIHVFYVLNSSKQLSQLNFKGTDSLNEMIYKVNKQSQNIVRAGSFGCKARVSGIWRMKGTENDGCTDDSYCSVDDVGQFYCVKNGFYAKNILRTFADRSQKPTSSACETKKRSSGDFYNAVRRVVVRNANRLNVFITMTSDFYRRFVLRELPTEEFDVTLPFFRDNNTPMIVVEPVGDPQPDPANDGVLLQDLVVRSNVAYLEMVDGEVERSYGDLYFQAEVHRHGDAVIYRLAECAVDGIRVN